MPTGAMRRPALTERAGPGPWRRLARYGQRLLCFGTGSVLGRGHLSGCSGVKDGLLVEKRYRERCCVQG